MHHPLCLLYAWIYRTLEIMTLIWAFTTTFLCGHYSFFFILVLYLSISGLFIKKHAKCKSCCQKMQGWDFSLYVSNLYLPYKPKSWLKLSRCTFLISHWRIRHLWNMWAENGTNMDQMDSWYRTKTFLWQESHCKSNQTKSKLSKRPWRPLGYKLHWI